MLCFGVCCLEKKTNLNGIRESLEITVEDVDPIRNEFLGFVSILLGDLADKKKIRQW